MSTRPKPEARLLVLTDRVVVQVTATANDQVTVIDHRGQPVLRGRYADLAAVGPVEVSFPTAELSHVADDVDTCGLESSSVRLTARFTAVREGREFVQELLLFERPLARTSLSLVAPPLGSEFTVGSTIVKLKSERGAVVSGEGVARPVKVTSRDGSMSVRMELGPEPGDVQRRLTACVRGKAPANLTVGYRRKLTPRQRWERAKVNAVALGYSSLLKNAEVHKGKRIVFGGKVMQLVGERDGEGEMLLTEYAGFGGIVMVRYRYEGIESALREDSYVLAYGSVAGDISYETTMGGTKTVPMILAEDFWHWSPFARGDGQWILYQTKENFWFWKK